jgi:hypothetical protein
MKFTRWRESICKAAPHHASSVLPYMASLTDRI